MGSPVTIKDLSFGFSQESGGLCGENYPMTYSMTLTPPNPDLESYLDLDTFTNLFSLKTVI